jgi:hypothetical protein
MRSLSSFVFRLAPLAAAALVLSACGGGSDNGMDGVDTNGTGTCVEPLKLDSGIVTASTATTLTVNGTALALDAARPGDCGVGAALFDEDTNAMIDTRAGALPPGTHVNAYSISALSGAVDIWLRDDVLGPVEAIDAVGGTLTVFGQAVRVDASTSWGNVTGGLPGLQLGDSVRVYGLYDGTTGAFRATRVERQASAPAAFSVTAPLQQLDTSAKTFAIGSAHISYAAVPASQLPALANGTLVRVHVQPLANAGTWTATAVQLSTVTFSPTQGVADDGSTVQGIVDTVAGSSSFTLAGLPVDASHASWTFLGNAHALGLGERVIARGAIVMGMMLAETVTVESP